MNTLPSNSKVYEDGELWSFIRRCMSQGKDIHLDHAERTYEEYSARLDVAALERLPELQAHIVRAAIVARGSNETAERPMTLGRLVLETARGNVKERTVTSKELAEIRANMARYFKGPLRFREPQTDSDGPLIDDAEGNPVAMLYWPCHPVEETAAAEQATYELGRAMAAALDPTSEKAGE